MNALLVYPELPDPHWSCRHALPFEGKRSAYPPLGLLTIAALLPGHWVKRLVDLNVRALTDSDLAWADIALVSSMMEQKEGLLRILTRCRARGIATVVGGPIAGSFEELPGHADHIVIGEAEDLIGPLVQDLERGSSKPEYKAAEPPPLDHIPLPDLTLIRPTQYSAMAIQYSREYPLNDEFGDLLEGFWRPHRTKSVAQVIIELEQLYHRKWRGPVFLVEDNLIGNKRNVKPLLAAVAEWNSLRRRPFAFFTQASVYLADDSELLELMKDAGFIRVIVGIDSSVPTHTKGPLKRRHTDRTLYERVRCIQQYGIEVMAASTVGIEHNTEEKFDPPNNYIQ